MVYLCTWFWGLYSNKYYYDFSPAAKQRRGHQCDYQWTVIAIIAWDGICDTMADFVYKNLSKDIGNHGKFLVLY